jgi:hypothetical protein
MSKPQRSKLFPSVRAVSTALRSLLSVKRSWPAVPLPTESIESLNTSVIALRERSFVQSREAGDLLSSFVTVGDLINLGVVTPDGKTLERRVEVLEALLYFEWQSLSSFTNPGWSDVDITYPTVVGSPAADQVEVRIASTAIAGLYVLNFSATFLIGATNNSTESRFSLDGGATWENFSRESKDTTDRNALAYSFPLEHQGGDYDFVFQTKKENATSTLQVFFQNIWFQAAKEL